MPQLDAQLDGQRDVQSPLKAGLVTGQIKGNGPVPVPLDQMVISFLSSITSIQSLPPGSGSEPRRSKEGWVWYVDDAHPKR